MDAEIHETLNTLVRARQELATRFQVFDPTGTRIPGKLLLVAGVVSSLRQLVDRAIDHGLTTEKVRLAAQVVGAFEAALPEKGAVPHQQVEAAKMIVGGLGGSPLHGELQRALAAPVNPDTVSGDDEAALALEQTEMISVSEVVRLFPDEFRDHTAVSRFVKEHDVKTRKPAPNRKDVDLVGLVRALRAARGTEPSDAQIDERLTGLRARLDSERQRKRSN